MEPCFYNPHLNGIWGTPTRDTGAWELEDRKRKPQVVLVRVSADRRTRAQRVYQLSQSFAAVNVTHFCHILTDDNAETPLTVLTWREFARRTGRVGRVPCNPTEYASLVAAIPQEWLQTLTCARRALLAANGTLTTSAYIAREPPVTGDWIQHQDGRLGKVCDGSPELLHVFAGKSGRTDGLASLARDAMMKCTEIDVVNDAVKQDLLNDEIYERLLQKAWAGGFVGGIFGTPCSTFSVVRMMGNATGKPSGPRQIRGRAAHERLGRHVALTDAERRELRIADTLVERSCELAVAIVSAGGNVLFENPCDRGGIDSDDSLLRGLYNSQWKDHSPLWLHPAMLRLRGRIPLKTVTFAQCQLGGRFQKYTTLWYSPALAPTLDDLHMCLCKCGNIHTEVARGKSTDEKWISAEAAAYPKQMNQQIVTSFRAALSGTGQISTYVPYVNEWYVRNGEGKLVGIMDEGATAGEADEGETLREPVANIMAEGGRPAHVWMQWSIPHSKAEAEWLERREDQRDPPILWYGGHVYDQRLVDAREIPYGGGVNLSHWAWAYGLTDREREPRGAANTDVFHIYELLLSYLFVPPRTFDCSRDHERDTDALGVGWTHLLAPHGGWADKEYDIERIVAWRDSGTGGEYLVRWAGYGAHMDTWEPQEEIEATDAFRRYDYSPVADVRSPETRACNGRMSATHGLSRWECATRADIFAQRSRWQAHRGTMDMHYSVLTDAEPLGNDRCRKVGPSWRTCNWCLFFRGMRIRETVNHAHLDCPVVRMALDTVFRAAVAVGCVNETAERRWRMLSVDDLVREQRTGLVTGVRLENVMRGTAEGAADDVAFGVLVVETHRAIAETRRLHAKQDVARWSHPITMIYGLTRKAMDAHVRRSCKRAHDQEQRLLILNPGIADFGENEGPVHEWEKQWVTTGWATESGISIPKSLLHVVGARAKRCILPVAKCVHTGFYVAFMRMYARTWGTLCAEQPDIVAAVPDPDLVVFYDGAYDQARQGGHQRAGFGFVAVADGANGLDCSGGFVQAGGGAQVQTDPDSPTYLGADTHTNNTGELTGLAESLRYLLSDAVDPGLHVVIRPDSEYTISIGTGDITPKKNRRLALTIRSMYLLAQKKCRRLRWAHVRGHSDNEWNNVVDSLAVQGAMAGPGGGTMSGSLWRRTRLDGDLRPAVPRIATSARWNASMEWQGGGATLREWIDYVDVDKSWVVQPDATLKRRMNTFGIHEDEIRRVQRSTTPFGILNLIPLPGINALQIVRCRNTALALVRRSEDSTDDERAHAEQRIYDACEQLRDSVARTRIREEIERRPRRIRHEFWCPVDIASLRSYGATPESLRPYVNAKGQRKQWGGYATFRDAANAMIAAAGVTEADPADTKWVLIQYRYGILGERLCEAGHIVASREYAVGFDPFKGWGRWLRHLALARYGYDFDDGASYPTAAAHFCDLGQPVMQRFLAHRKPILYAMAAYYFEGLPADVGYERVKQLIHMLDMDGSMDTWMAEWRIPSHKTAARCPITLPDGPFDLRTLIEIQKQRTDWIARRKPRMLELISQIKNGPDDNAKCTLRSYLLQEYEGISRGTKIAYASYSAIKIFSLQHDGVVMGLPEGRDEHDTAEMLTLCCSRALGYCQTVDVKPMLDSVTPTRWDCAADYLTNHGCIPMVPSGRGRGIMNWIDERLDDKESDPTHDWRMDITIVWDGDSKNEDLLAAAAERWRRTTYIGPAGGNNHGARTWDTFMTAERAYLNVGDEDGMRPHHNEPTILSRAEMVHSSGVMESRTVIRRAAITPVPPACAGAESIGVPDAHENDGPPDVDTDFTEAGSDVPEDDFAATGTDDVGWLMADDTPRVDVGASPLGSVNSDSEVQQARLDDYSDAGGTTHAWLNRELRRAERVYSTGMDDGAGVLDDVAERRRFWQQKLANRHAQTHETDRRCDNAKTQPELGGSDSEVSSAPDEDLALCTWKVWRAKCHDTTQEGCVDGRTGRAGRVLAHAPLHTDTVLPMTRLPNEDITMYARPTERPKVGDIVQIIEGAIGTRATLREQEGWITQCPLNTGRVVVLGEHTRETHTLWSREIEAHRRGSASAEEVLKRWSSRPSVAGRDGQRRQPQASLALNPHQHQEELQRDAAQRGVTDDGSTRTGIRNDGGDVHCENTQHVVQTTASSTREPLHTTTAGLGARGGEVPWVTRVYRRVTGWMSRVGSTLSSMVPSLREHDHGWNALSAEDDSVAQHASDAEFTAAGGRVPSPPGRRSAASPAPPSGGVAVPCGAARTPHTHFPAPLTPARTRHPPLALIPDTLEGPTDTPPMVWPATPRTATGNGEPTSISS